MEVAADTFLKYWKLYNILILDNLTRYWFTINVYVKSYIFFSYLFLVFYFVKRTDFQISCRIFYILCVPITNVPTYNWAKTVKSQKTSVGLLKIFSRRHEMYRRNLSLFSNAQCIWQNFCQHLSEVYRDIRNWWPPPWHLIQNFSIWIQKMYNLN